LATGPSEDFSDHHQKISSFAFPFAFPFASFAGHFVSLRIFRVPRNLALPDLSREGTKEAKVGRWILPHTISSGPQFSHTSNHLTAFARSATGSPFDFSKHAP
jgi:hypothetical protein